MKKKNTFYAGSTIIHYNTPYSHIFMCIQMYVCTLNVVKTQADFAVSHVMRLIFDRMAYGALLELFSIT